MMSSQWFCSRSAGSKTEDTLERVEVHEETEEMESALVRGDRGIVIVMFHLGSKQGVVTLLRLVKIWDQEGLRILEILRRSLYLLRIVGEFLRADSGSHEFSEASYPLQDTR